MRKGPENEAHKGLLVFLDKASKKNGAPIWATVAEKLATPRRNRASVNVGKVASVAGASSTVIVPGKLLSGGEMTKKLNVAAFSASAGARAKIAKAGGKLLTIEELVAANPKGSGVMIVQ